MHGEPLRSCCPAHNKWTRTSRRKHGRGHRTQGCRCFRSRTPWQSSPPAQRLRSTASGMTRQYPIAHNGRKSSEIERPVLALRGPQRHMTTPVRTSRKSCLPSPAPPYTPSARSNGQGRRRALADLRGAGRHNERRPVAAPSPICRVMAEPCFAWTAKMLVTPWIRDAVQGMAADSPCAVKACLTWGGDGRIQLAIKVMGRTRPAPWSFSCKPSRAQPCEAQGMCALPAKAGRGETAASLMPATCRSCPDYCWPSSVLGTLRRAGCSTLLVSLSGVVP